MLIILNKIFGDSVGRKKILVVGLVKMSSFVKKFGGNTFDHSCECVIFKLHRNVDNWRIPFVFALERPYFVSKLLIFDH